METKLCLLVLAAMLGAVSGGVCGASCANDTKPAPSEGARVPDPTNCFSFYVCSDVDDDGTFEISDGPVPCPNGEYFNDSSRDCVAIPSSGSIECEALCNPCEVACTEPGGLLPDPYNCQQYFVCLHTVTLPPVMATCPGNKVFDYQSGLCGYVEDGARCYDLCDPCMTYCVEEGRIANPADCTSYFYCEPPEGLAAFHCAEDEYYDGTQKECISDEGETCEPTCPGGSTELY